MALVKVKPTSPGRRAAGEGGQPGLAQGQAARLAGREAVQWAGRNTMGASPRAIRVAVTSSTTGSIDFRRNKDGIVAKVERLEYDPNRSAHIALLCYADGERRYIIAPKGLAVGAQVVSGADAPIKRRQHAAGAQHSGWHDHPLRRDAARQGRAAGAFGGHLACSCWHAREAMRNCACARARSAACMSIAAPPSARSATRRTACGSIGKAGANALARHASDGARRGDEPDRPPARWRRGPYRWSAIRSARGDADQGLSHPQQQAHATHDRRVVTSEVRGRPCHVQSRKARLSTGTC